MKLSFPIMFSKARSLSEEKMNAPQQQNDFGPESGLPSREAAWVRIIENNII